MSRGGKSFLNPGQSDACRWKYAGTQSAYCFRPAAEKLALRSNIPPRWTEDQTTSPLQRQGKRYRGGEVTPRRPSRWSPVEPYPVSTYAGILLLHSLCSLCSLCSLFVVTSQKKKKNIWSTGLFLAVTVSKAPEWLGKNRK